ncbi:MAG: NADH-quinone oxidoreductase subunit C [Candidatus Thermochlorobacter aerophilum]|jgi:NADH-quinone oxidoreductase subunit C|uniref:NADH-quinone oxidoreductase subunit C n=1 Tax=Candidatus Thermochlorobacter aerophilus TaxID=1868324 RepID=A0A395M0F4_9BACT|nr:MAG: NADH-quinone oxidoreductase subunit C [Candidatus Thermochlorobacter aerophilum]
MTDIIQALQARFGHAIRDITEFRGETTLLVETSAIVDICRVLKLEHGFNYCADICGADRFTEEERFEVIYNLTNLEKRLRLRLKVRVSEENPVVPSVTSVWRAANWHERETYDMYGIRFEGHPDLRRMYMPEDFEYYPLRKDFPLIGVPGSIPLPEFDKKAPKQDAGRRYNQGEQI